MAKWKVINEPRREKMRRKLKASGQKVESLNLWMTTEQLLSPELLVFLLKYMLLSLDKNICRTSKTSRQRHQQEMSPSLVLFVINLSA